MFSVILYSKDKAQDPEADKVTSVFLFYCMRG